MHKLQKSILEQSQKYDLGGMTLREIGELVGESHPQKVKHHLDQLKRKGYLQEGIDGGISRVAAETDSFIHLPIMGRANCGEAMAIAEENINGYLTISKGLINLAKVSGMYVLKAVGDSMNQASIGNQNKPIHNGDYLVVDGTVKDPQDGECVVSVINGAANVKQFSKDANRIVLKSQSSRDYAPIIIDRNDFNPDYMIAGRVLEVIEGV